MHRDQARSGRAGRAWPTTRRAPPAPRPAGPPARRPAAPAPRAGGRPAGAAAPDRRPAATATARPRRRRLDAERREARNPPALEGARIAGEHARRQRRRQHVAGAGHVVVGHPGGQRDEGRRHERRRVAHRQHLAQLHRRVGRDVGGDDDAGQAARPERHVHARARHRRRRRLGPAVGQHVEGRHGHGHRDDPAHAPSRSRTFFMSSHTSRLAGGFLRRYAGWNVGMQRGAAPLEHAAAQLGDRLGRAEQRLGGELAERRRRCAAG